MVARVHGTPTTDIDSTGPGRLGDLVDVAAGFRDQFYGLVPHVREARPAGDSDGVARLVTTGAIDPLWCRWGERPTRFAGRRWAGPVVEPSTLTGDPRLARWVAARLVPKVLVATQTRVMEAVVDPLGQLLPSVPVLAVAPAHTDDLWTVAAALLAPPVSAWALHRAGGTALTADAIKLSAAQVRAIPLPEDERRWREAAAGLADGTLDHGPFARLMTEAYGLAADHEVVGWWLSRLPSWRGRPVARRHR